MQAECLQVGISSSSDVEFVTDFDVEQANEYLHQQQQTMVLKNK